jgi:glutamyl-tRNA reductase
VAQAEAIISAGVHDFMHWLETREVVPTVRALRDHAERMRRHELERALKLLARGEHAEKILEQLSHSLTNKFLHAPTSALNEAQAKEREALVSALERLYQIKLPE